MKSKSKILIVDDDLLVLESFYQLFIDDYDVIQLSTGKDVLATLEDNQDIDVIVLDIKMAHQDGLETAIQIKQVNPLLPIIFYTGYPGDYSEKEIDEDYRPFDYVVKNERPARLKRAIKNAIEFYHLKNDSQKLIDRAFNEYHIIGKSESMQQIYRMIEMIAPTPSRVMIMGPTGSGKELVARAIHKKSSRADKDLVIFNCNHKAPDLVESELFGHVKGAFTGAIENRIGLFEFANDSTIMLDEIGDLDITTQAKLLRVLECGEIQRVGSVQTRRVDVRVICATHRNLPDMVADQRFREDLYYRLKGTVIQLPALKDRSEDIPQLAEYFIQEYCRNKGDGMKVLDTDAMKQLIQYDWPGNVRQLKYTIQALVDLTYSHYITKADLEKFITKSEFSNSSNGSLNDRVREFKRKILIETLATYKTKKEAASSLGIDPSNFTKLLRDLNIDNV